MDAKGLLTHVASSESPLVIVNQLQIKIVAVSAVGARELLKHVTSRLIALELYLLHFRSTQLENNKKVTGT